MKLTQVPFPQSYVGGSISSVSALASVESGPLFQIACRSSWLRLSFRRASLAPMRWLKRGSASIFGQRILSLKEVWFLRFRAVPSCADPLVFSVNRIHTVQAGSAAFGRVGTQLAHKNSINPSLGLTFQIGISQRKKSPQPEHNYCHNRAPLLSQPLYVLSSQAASNHNTSHHSFGIWSVLRRKIKRRSRRLCHFNP